jgi:hypothetical protein
MSVLTEEAFGPQSMIRGRVEYDHRGLRSGTWLDESGAWQGVMIAQADPEWEQRIMAWLDSKRRKPIWE